MPDDRGWIAVVEDDPIMGESSKERWNWRGGARAGGGQVRRRRGLCRNVRLISCFATSDWEI